MRFLRPYPEIPDKLIVAQERGDIVFVCGAGVSAYQSDLPSFKRLAEKVYENLRENYEDHPAERRAMADGQYDRVLHCLEQRLTSSDSKRKRVQRDIVRKEIRAILRAPDKFDGSAHTSLLRLSCNAEGAKRLLTTNFDTLFERAWYDERREALKSYAGISLPQPNSERFVGILHLHGRLEDPRPELCLSETDLVLTSAEFGEAYLKSGWASRYVYDLLRAYTVVLVGYQAEDPPMRYLLEALESDRERFPDLHQVYAFAPTDPGEEEDEKALWQAKGIIPIPYHVNGRSHAALYVTLRMWAEYAEDPTAFRRKLLADILLQEPDFNTAEDLSECDALLSHGDASQILGELNPEAKWLPILTARRIFDRTSTKPNPARPGRWIAKRLDDIAMIRACADLHMLDEDSRYLIEQALTNFGANLSPIRRKAWRLILTAKTEAALGDDGLRWHRLSKTIAQGDIDFETRRLACELLRPRLTLDAPYRLRNETSSTPETLDRLLSIGFQCEEDYSHHDILESWPKDAGKEAALLSALERTLIDALEEAEEAGYIGKHDSASSGVSSIAPHSKNDSHFGFLPIIGVIAALWERIANSKPHHAHAISQTWGTSRFLLVQRLRLFAMRHQAWTAEDIGDSLQNLADIIFWNDTTQVEIMRLIEERWLELETNHCEVIEARYRKGPPIPTSFPNPKDEAVWLGDRDDEIFRCLKRIQSAGAILSLESLNVLDEISARNPDLVVTDGDSSDFPTWHHEPEELPKETIDPWASVPDDKITAQVSLAKRNRPFGGDVWDSFCTNSPERAFRALCHDAEANAWNTELWRGFLWTIGGKEDSALHPQIGEVILHKMPPVFIRETIQIGTLWLKRCSKALSLSSPNRESLFFALWDHLADLQLASPLEGSPPPSSDPLIHLAEALLKVLNDSMPEVESGLGTDFLPRFNRVLEAQDPAGRAALAEALAFLDSIDPIWTEKLVPIFSWNNPEALGAWKAFSRQPHVGSPKLFHSLKPDFLKTSEWKILSNHQIQSLTARLLSIMLWHQRGTGAEYQLTEGEFKRALASAPEEARRSAAWNLWKTMISEKREPTDRSSRWRQIVAPILQNAWPRDANLRSEKTTRHLISIALECEAAFPEAVETILDFVTPYTFYQIAYLWSLRRESPERMEKHPIPFIKLLNALIDPNICPIPSDLDLVLLERAKADPLLLNDPAYIRLAAISRRASA